MTNSSPSPIERAASDSVAPLDMLVLRGGYALAWTAPWGAAFLRIERFAPERPYRALRLGPAREGCGAPRLIAFGGSWGVAWCGPESAMFAMTDGERVRSVVELTPGVRSIQVVGQTTESAWVVFETGESVGALRIFANGKIERMSDPLIVQSDHCDFAASRGLESCVAMYRNDARVCVVDPERGRSSLVRHELPAGVSALAASTMGNRTYLAYARDESVDAMVISRSGRVIERGHPLLRRSDARFERLELVWEENRFVTLAIDAVRNRVHWVDGERSGELVEASRNAALGYRDRKVIVAEMGFADTPALRFWIGDPSGSGARRHRLAVEMPEDVWRVRAASAVEGLLVELSSSGDYRGSGLRDVGQRVSGAGWSISIDIEPRCFRLRLALAPPIELRRSWSLIGWFLARRRQHEFGRRLVLEADEIATGLARSMGEGAPSWRSSHRLDPEGGRTGSASEMNLVLEVSVLPGAAMVRKWVHEVVACAARLRSELGG